MKKIAKEILRVILTVIAPIVNIVLRLFGVVVLYRVSGGIGDIVCITSIVKALNENYGLRAIVVTKLPEIFFNNVRVLHNIDASDRDYAFVLNALQGSNIVHFTYKKTKLFKTHEEFAKNTKYTGHWRDLNTIHMKYDIKSQVPQCEIFLDEKEQLDTRHKFKLPDEYAVIISDGKTSYTENKAWGFNNFQQLVKSMPDIKWVQIGTKSETKLDGVIDLRSETTIRELFCVCSMSKFIVSTEGLLNHISSAFNIPSFTIFTGYQQINIAKYKNTIPIMQSNMPSCFPCWERKACGELNKKECLITLTPELVSEIIKSHIL